MSWKLLGRAFRMSFAISSGLGVLPFDKFLRQVTYVILENIEAM